MNRMAKSCNPSKDVFRVCLVCHLLVPEGKGIYQSHLRKITHQGTCAQMVDGLERVYDHSAHGRWRPLLELHRLVNGARCISCSKTS